ncbi:MAG TPA: 2,3-bisphosphoglycerate-independent phosphoglycerate mutase [Bacillota bacterium]|nr:2,3-bisphosphoglycerate-independent phosphoglycerate mutase [Bacillota bacterium]
MKRESKPGPVALIIIDGWGISEEKVGNAVLCVPTPNLDWLQAAYPASYLESFGQSVGLMPGQMGDSNVGHLNLGAGRIVYQDLVRITTALMEHFLDASPEWLDLAERLALGGGRLHLFGLLSDGGVHSHIDHLKAILRQCRGLGLTVFLHAQLDGRDVAPDSGAGFIADIVDFMACEGVGRLATVMGRYYGMDRDQRWERTEQAYLAMVKGQGQVVTDAERAVRESYAAGVTDEFVAPMVLDDAQFEGRISDRDEMFFFNFRADRARQIIQAFWSTAVPGFDRASLPAVGITTMTEYRGDFPFPHLFPPQNLSNTLGEIVSKAGRTQLRLAETEKYAHVTYFFNGGTEAPFPGEERVLVPSPKVATYDLQPEMSAAAVTEVFLKGIEKGYDLIVMNYANMDMVGHTGDFAATCRAVATVDSMVGVSVRAVLGRGGTAVITADHGNAEKMLNETGDVYTAHTLNPVRVIIAGEETRLLPLRGGGILADVAPTILELMSLAQPAEMTGRSLIIRR